MNWKQCSTSPRSLNKLETSQGCQRLQTKVLVAVVLIVVVLVVILVLVIVIVAVVVVVIVVRVVVIAVIVVILIVGQNWNKQSTSPRAVNR